MKKDINKDESIRAVNCRTKPVRIEADVNPNGDDNVKDLSIYVSPEDKDVIIRKGDKVILWSTDGKEIAPQGWIVYKTSEKKDNVIQLWVSHKHNDVYLDVTHPLLKGNYTMVIVNNI